MTEAKTEMCGECGGQGTIRDADLCETCNGTGIVTTGYVVGTLGADSGAKPTGQVFRCHSKECGALSLRSELESDGSCKCGASVGLVTGVLADQYRRHKETIAEQAAEIERLSRVHGEQMGTVVMQSEKLTALDQERATLEAERDDLRLQVRSLTVSVLKAEQASEDEAKALKERDEARALNEKYLAVIHAKDAEIVAINECWKKSAQAGVAMMEAGLRFKHVSFDTTIKTEDNNA